MSNAQFYINTRDNPEAVNQYSRLFLYTSMSLAVLAFAASITGLAVAATILTGGLAGIAITGCIFAGIASTYAFFKAYNVLSAQSISREQSPKGLPHAIEPEAEFAPT